MVLRSGHLSFIEKHFEGLDFSSKYHDDMKC